MLTALSFTKMYREPHRPTVTKIDIQASWPASREPLLSLRNKDRLVRTAHITTTINTPVRWQEAHSSRPVSMVHQTVTTMVLLTRTLVGTSQLRLEGEEARQS